MRIINSKLLEHYFKTTFVKAFPTSLHLHEVKFSLPLINFQLRSAEDMIIIYVNIYEN